MGAKRSFGLEVKFVIVLGCFIFLHFSIKAYFERFYDKVLDRSNESSIDFPL